MQEYSEINKKLTSEEKVDPVTLEYFQDIDDHPRKTISIRRSNNRPYPYLTSTIYNIINSGNARDPVTREPLTDLTKQRVLIYYKGLTKFPDFKLNKDTLSLLFKKWEKNLTENYPDPNTKLEAQCFLQIQDLVDMFFEFNCKGSLKNREETEKYLQDSGTKWILRYGSFQDTEFNKGYVFSYIDKKGYHHLPILHKIGDGFYLNAITERKQLLTDDLQSNLSFPTIVDVIEYLLYAIN